MMKTAKYLPLLILTVLVKDYHGFSSTYLGDSIIATPIAEDNYSKGRIKNDILTTMNRSILKLEKNKNDRQKPSGIKNL